MVDTAGPWVDVVFLQDDDYYGINDDGYDSACDLSELGIDEMAEYMSKWDYGQETDDAHTRDEAPWGTDDRLYEVTVGGIDYVMSVNYGLGYASLNRRPLQIAN